MQGHHSETGAEGPLPYRAARISTPFGPKRLSLDMVASQLAADGEPIEGAVHKWHVFRALCEAKQAVGISDRSLTVLSGLLTFHPETALTDDGGLVVFPSNQALSQRAHGMAPATLRRHLAQLVDRDLIIRRDSPNGKRYARKGQDGEIILAFGFDLSPIVRRAAEFDRLAAAARAERQALVLIRERITLARRDIAKMIALGTEEAIPEDWPGLHARYLAVVHRIPRTPERETLEPVEQELKALSDEVTRILERHVDSAKKSASDDHSEPHLQNSNPEPPTDFEPDFRESRERAAEAELPSPRLPRRSYPLAAVMEACPDIGMYARHGISSWPDLISTAGMVRSMLGVSPSAYEEAVNVFGREDAATLVAAILQRSGTISNPGGYLRTLTEKQRSGRFSLGPMLMALLRSRVGQKFVMS